MLATASGLETDLDSERGEAITRVKASSKTLEEITTTARPSAVPWRHALASLTVDLAHHDDRAHSTLVPYISPSGSAMSSRRAPLGSRK
jgi:hypothetical protein